MIFEKSESQLKCFVKQMIGPVIIIVSMAAFQNAPAAPREGAAEQAKDAAPLRRFSIIVGGSRAGALTGGWSSQLESSFMSAGFDDTDPGGYSIFGYQEPEVRPITRLGSRESAWIIAGVRIKPRLDLRARFAYRSEIGTTIGHCFESYGSTSYSYDIYVKPSVTTWAISIMYELRERLCMGFGPAFTFANFECQSFVVSNETAYAKYTQDKIRKIIPGVLFEMGYRLPLKSRFFAELTGQYFLMPETPIGPLEFEHQDGTTGKTIPETDLNLNWGQLGLGLGIAF